MSNPVSRLVPRRVITSGSMAACEVRYAYGVMQVSMMSTPASMALSMLIGDMPEVKWLCR